MYTLSVKNDRGDTLTLTNNSDYTVYKVDGLAPPKSTINSSVNTTTDGSKINSARLESRNIVIYIAIERDVEASRINLYKYFPAKKDVTLYFKNDTRNVCICGTVEVIECDLFANKQIAQVSLICAKPYFKDVEYLITKFSDVTAVFEFPFAIPAEGVEISTLGTNTRKTIINTGDVETGVVIELYAIGTVVNPIIYDVLNHTYLKLNFTMRASDKVVINTNVGEKSIVLTRDGATINIIGYMARGSSWFKLSAGDNVFTYDCESGGGNLQLTFTTNILYVGV